MDFDTFESATRIEYAMGPRRPHKPDDEVLRVLQAGAERALGPGSRVVVTSGKGEHGSPRHRQGHAADAKFYDPSGRVVSLDDPRAKTLALALGESGALGIGAGPEYMGNETFHVDVYPRERYTQSMGPAWGSFGDRVEADFVRASGEAPVNAPRATPAQPTANMGSTPVGLRSGSGPTPVQQPPGNALAGAQPMSPFDRMVQYNALREMVMPRRNYLDPADFMVF